MDTEEIDLWYDNEKEKAFKEYLEGIEKNRKRDEIEKIYREKTRKIREKYINLYEKNLKPGFTKKLSLRIKLFMDKIAEVYKE